jgi:hypothetical protein
MAMRAPEMRTPDTRVRRALEQGAAWSGAGVRQKP